MPNRTTGCPFPIWSIFITTDKTVPTWIRPGTYRVPFGKGRCLVCVDNESQNVNLKTAEKEFGSAGLTQQDITQGEEWGTVKVTTGASNYQPSITVYMWKRVFNKNEVQNYNAFDITAEQASDVELYGDQAIIDANTLKAKQPDPYNPSPAS